jgi:hypothetical protein
MRIEGWGCVVVHSTGHVFGKALSLSLGSRRFSPRISFPQKEKQGIVRKEAHMTGPGTFW